MKRVIAFLAVLALCVTAYADMNDVSFGSQQTIGAATNAVTRVLRGTLEGVYVDVTTATTRTQTVTVASSQQTLFTKAVSADAWYPLRYGTLYGSTGAALVGNGTTTNKVYAKAPMAGSITCTIVGGNGASVTNTTEVTVIYERK